MNTPFSEFEKMPAQLKTLHLTEKQMKEIEKSLWVVTEKAHGANVSFVYENRTLRFAKRKAYLSWDDDFFGFQLVVEKLEDKILAFFEQLRKEIPAEKYLLYGELIGGAYPHTAIKVVEKVQAIQTGVYYCPDIQFFAFDIALEKEGEKIYLAYETALSYFEQHQLLHAKPLFVGKFTACMDFPTRRNSTIPEALGLPPLEHNIIEGIVIKLYQNPQKIAYQPRIILKIKNEEFAEKTFHQAEKWTYLPEVRSKTEELAFILEEMRKYVSPNRLQNVLSKIGRLTNNNLHEVQATFLQDVLTDFNEDFENLLSELSLEEQKWLEKRLEAEIDFLF